jgi:hypothetical protein
MWRHKSLVLLMTSRDPIPSNDVITCDRDLSNAWFARKPCQVDSSSASTDFRQCKRDSCKKYGLIIYLSFYLKGFVNKWRHELNRVKDFVTTTRYLGFRQLIYVTN